jgi:hypothetical protein
MSTSALIHHSSSRPSQRHWIAVGGIDGSCLTLVTLVDRGDFAVGVACCLRARPGAVAASSYQPLPLP